MGSPDLARDIQGPIDIPLSVKLRHIGLCVAEEDLGGLEAELPPDAGEVGVAELVRVPAVGLAPALQLGLLCLRKALADDCRKRLAVVMSPGPGV